MRVLVVVAFIAGLLPFCGSNVCFAEATESSEVNFMEMSLEELMDIPIVISGSKQENSLLQSSIPISIVTEDDIHYSGHATLEEALMFVPGLDIVPIDKRRYAVGVRGLHGVWSDRVKLLVDGRNADSIVYGGPEFQSLTVHVEDIERIEIVRGPAGGAWGANAFTGVINIITKKPEDVQGGMMASRINEYGDHYSIFRWGGKADDFSYRTSVSFEDFETSADSISGSVGYDSWAPGALQFLAGVSSYEPRDDGRYLKVDSDFSHALGDDTSLRYGFGYRHNDFGSGEIQGYLSPNRSNADYANSFVRLDHEYESGDHIYLQYYNRFYSGYDATFETHGKFFQNMFEVQYDVSLLTDHETSVGAQFEYDKIDSTYRSTPSMTFHMDDSKEYTYGGFVVDVWNIHPRFWLENQFRMDDYSKTHTDWAGRTTAFYALEDEREHVLHVSAARAFRTPFQVLRNMTSQYIPIGGGMYLINIDRAGKLDNERTYSIEAGYAGRLAQGIHLNVNGYFQRYDDLIGYAPSSPKNLEGADSYGVEAELMLQREDYNISLWYTYNDFDADNPNQSLRAYLPSPHKLGATYRLFMEQDWVFNANFKYMDYTYFNDDGTTVAFDTIARLDLALSKSFKKQNLEVMVGVNDVLDSTRMGATEVNAISNHEIPGRMFFARCEYRF